MLTIRGLQTWRERLERVRVDVVLASALAAEAETMAEAVREGLSAKPGEEHERPWARTGALRESVGSLAVELSAVVGSSDPAAVPQEFGTRSIPARPFLVPVATALGEQVARNIGEVLAGALHGDVERQN